MSEAGRNTLARHGITPLCEIAVKEIHNRTNTGMCPMEEAVEKITDPDEGLIAIKKKLAAIKKISR